MILEGDRLRRVAATVWLERLEREAVADLDHFYGVTPGQAPAAEWVARLPWLPVRGGAVAHALRATHPSPAPSRSDPPPAPVRDPDDWHSGKAIETGADVAFVEADPGDYLAARIAEGDRRG